MAYVYRHIRLDKNEPFYIGIGNSNDNFYRAKTKAGRNSIWNKIVSKSSYKTQILFNDLTWEEACKKEKELIVLYGRIFNKTGILSNISDGGEGAIGVPSWNKGKSLSRSHIEKIKNSAKESNSRDSVKLLKLYKLGDKIIDNDNNICHYGASTAAKFLNISTNYLNDMLRGRRKMKYNLVRIIR